MAALLAPCAAIGALLAADHGPRFMLGDSESYLTTGLFGYMPPDRSWLFGFAARGVMDLGHSVSTLVVLQAALLLLVVTTCRAHFGRAAGGVCGFLFFALAVALDPLTEIYARFYMTDFIASAAVVGFSASLSGMLGNGPSWQRLAVLVVCAIASTFLRVACAVIQVLALGLCIAAAAGRLLAHRQDRSDRSAEFRRIGVSGRLLIVPILSVSVLAAANALVFGERFDHQPFVNKASGEFLMGVFAPALALEDIQAAGVSIDQATFDRLRLNEFDRR